MGIFGDNPPDVRGRDQAEHYAGRDQITSHTPLLLPFVSLAECILD
jgi:hypothetical protein